MDDLDLGVTLKGFAPGQKVFNRYTLQRLLGRGGMGVVWLARDEELEREVALKFLPEVVAMDAEAVRDLKRETRRSLELTHPHIIRIYDFVQDARTAAISMEYVAGDTLARRKLEQPHACFQPAELERWVGQLAEALDYAHRRAQIVHRDLKPANLMIDARGDLKIADFGIAASVSDSVSRVSAQAGSSGTPLYMSPQQMMGEKPAVADDVYAMGALLYELLTGKPPFHSGNIIAQVQAKVPPSIAGRRAELGLSTGTAVPDAWERTIAACLAKEPGERPLSAGEVWQRLGGAGGKEPEAVVPPSPAEVPAAPADVPSPPPAGPARASALRRYVLAPVAAVIPGAALGGLLLAGIVQEEGYFHRKAMLATTVGGAGLALLAAVAAVVHGLIPRHKLAWVAGLGLASGLAAGGIFSWSASQNFPLAAPDHLLNALLAGAVGALSGTLLHRMASPGVSGASARARVRPVFFWSGAITLLLVAGLHFGLAPREYYVRLATAQEEAWRAAEEEWRRTQEAERLAAASRRREEARRMVPEAYRSVFDRAPAAPVVDGYVELLVKNPGWDAARLRRELRSSEDGRRGGRLRVPGEFPTIAAALAAAVEGNVVQVGPGTYPEGIVLNKKVSLVGAGAGQSVIAVDADRAALVANGVTGGLVEGFTFRHTSTNENNSRASVVGLNECEVTFRRNRVESANGNGLHLKGERSRSTIEDNVIRGSRWVGLAIYGGSGNVIRRNIIEENDQMGIMVIERLAGTEISDNTIRGNKQNGIWLSAGDNVVLLNNRVTGNGTTGMNYGGIGIRQGQPRLRGNEARDNIGTGIWWHSDATPRLEPGNVSDGQQLAPTP